MNATRMNCEGLWKSHATCFITAVQFNSVLNGTEDAVRVHGLPVRVCAMEMGSGALLAFCLRPNLLAFSRKLL